MSKYVYAALAIASMAIAHRLWLFTGLEQVAIGAGVYCLLAFRWSVIIRPLQVGFQHPVLAAAAVTAGYCCFDSESVTAMLTVFAAATALFAVLPWLLRQLIWALTPQPYKALHRFSVAGMVWAHADDRMRELQKQRRRLREEQACRFVPLPL